jgi:hypothetical protein
MAKLSNRAEYYFNHIREAQAGQQFGGTYREAHAMIEAVSKWADFNFDDWLDLPSNPSDIEDVTIGEFIGLLQNRITETEGYYKQANGVYERDALVDFVNGKKETA